MFQNKAVSKRLGFGCVKLSAMRSEREALRILKSAYDGGIRWFDTAPLYGQGYSELILGKFLKTLNSSERNEVEVVTKFGLGPIKESNLSVRLALPANYFRKKITSFNKQPPSHGNSSVSVEPRAVDLEYIKAQKVASLRRLGVERIHGYLAHEMVLKSLSDEARFFLESQRKAGLVVHLGFGTSVANFLRWMPSGVDESWAIIQYEVASTDNMLRMKEAFPRNLHVNHSLFSLLNRDSERAADTKSFVSEFDYSRLIFSTSSVVRLKHNLEI